jgi:hypothetical protein
MEKDPRYVEYLRRWETLGPELEKIRAQEIRKADTRQAIYMFDAAFKIAIRDLPARDTSGLMYWGDLINKWRQRG